jgi:hypothetical protein
MPSSSSCFETHFTRRNAGHERHSSVPIPYPNHSASSPLHFIVKWRYALFSTFFIPSHSDALVLGGFLFHSLTLHLHIYFPPRFTARTLLAQFRSFSVLDLATCMYDGQVVCGTRSRHLKHRLLATALVPLLFAACRGTLLTVGFECFVMQTPV